MFIPTLREAPAGVEDPGPRMLIRAGYVRRLAAGGFAYLPLARRSLRKIVQIAREELDSAGAQEMLLPAGQNALPLAQEIRSYRQLPQIWYQFQAGLECWSFDRAEDSRGAIQAAFGRILDRCGLRYEIAGTHFVISSESGGEIIVRGSNYAATLDDAETVPVPPSVPDPEGDFAPEAFPTPNVKSIAEVAAFTGLPETSQIKSLVMMAGDKPVLVLVRGDHQLSESKLAALVAAPVSPARYETIRKWFGADAGSLGPVGVREMRILADNALRGRRNMISGANRNDFHLRHVTPGEDFEAEFADLRQPTERDACITGGGPLRFEKGHRIARVEKLRRVPLAGQEVLTGGSSMNLEQLLFALAEQNQDRDGLTLPFPVTPFTAVITPVFYAEPAQRDAALEIYQRALSLGIDVLLDDRDERPGVKFKDADLAGIPYRVNLGKKLAQGIVEIVERGSGQIKEVPAPQAWDFHIPHPSKTAREPER